MKAQSKMLLAALIALLIASLGAVFVVNKFSNKEVVIVEPSKTEKIYIEKPIEIVKYDTVFVENEVQKIVRVPNEVNQKLLSKYQKAIKANDSLQALAVLKDVLEIRDYEERLEDSLQTITVSSQVTGFLMHQEIEYITKPQTKVVLRPKKGRLYFMGAYTYNMADRPALGVNFTWSNKNRKVLHTVGFDTKNKLLLSLQIKI